MATHRIVFAPDSFKGSASAADAAAALARGWATVRPDDELVLRPMADGGEGTLDAFGTLPGAREIPVRAPGPDGRERDASWVRLADGTGVVELARTSGLPLLAAPMPLDATTAGFGTAIAAALDAGVERLLLGLGGSASTDGGAGVLTALGARLLDAAGSPIGRGARGLQALASVDLTGLRPPPAGGATVLADVRNPLTGPHGAARVFGPQKGATPAQVEELDAALARFADLAGGDPRRIGAGAAGGTGWALALWGAVPQPGGIAIARAIGLPAALAGADLLVTGEGRYDATTANGKVVQAVRTLAAAVGLPVALVAGSIEDRAPGFEAAIQLADLAGSVAAAIAGPLRALERAGALLAEGVPSGAPG